MKRHFLGWLDDRSGWRKLAHEALYENVPGGARWRYVWGSTLVFTFVVQILTGLFLWMGYAPSATTAWESVNYIQEEMWGGWLLRGLHHFTAQSMVVLMVIHLMQVVIDGAYKAPRELNFWTGVVLMLLVLGLSLTGYLLPWDQKGFWASKVATSLAGLVPGVGSMVQQFLIGGPDYGHHTLTRFFAFHAGFLPAMVAAVLGVHLYVFRRHGIKARDPKRRPDVGFWPDQIFCDAVACLAVLGAVLTLTVWHRGAELSGPADPSEPYPAARPEWYFLFLFQFLKYFPGHWEIVGALVIPGVLLGVFVLMPVLGRWELGHRFNVVFLFSILAAAGFLTWRAWAEDRANPGYQLAVTRAAGEAARVKELASVLGIPSSGAVTLLRQDPLTEGPKLFARHCATCHRFGGHDGMGGTVADAASAPDLKGFATRDWIAGTVDPERVGSVHYFGGTKFKEGKMVRWTRREVPKFDAVQREALVKVVEALSAEAALPAQARLDADGAVRIEEGRKAFDGVVKCSECHQFRKPNEDATGPDLTGYGSRSWLVDFIANPKHDRFYGKRNDRMPAYGDEKILDARAIGLVADWLRGEWVRATNGVGSLAGGR